MNEKNEACESKVFVCLQRPYERTEGLLISNFLQCVLYQAFSMAVS